MSRNNFMRSLMNLMESSSPEIIQEDEQLNEDVLTLEEALGLPKNLADNRVDGKFLRAFMQPAQVKLLKDRLTDFVNISPEKRQELVQAIDDYEADDWLNHRDEDKMNSPQTLLSVIDSDMRGMRIMKFGEIVAKASDTFSNKSPNAKNITSIISDALRTLVIDGYLVKHGTGEYSRTDKEVEGKGPKTIGFNKRREVEPARARAAMDQARSTRFGRAA